MGLNLMPFWIAHIILKCLYIGPPSHSSLSAKRCYWGSGVVDNGMAGDNMLRMAGAMTGLALDVGVAVVKEWGRIAGVEAE